MATIVLGGCAEGTALEGGDGGSSGGTPATSVTAGATSGALAATTGATSATTGATTAASGATTATSSQATSASSGGGACQGVTCAPSCACVEDAAMTAICECTLSQTASAVPEAMNSVICTAGSYQEENRYFRIFDLAASGIPSAFTVTGVRFGVHDASSPNGTQSLTVKLHALGGPLTLANLTPIATATATVPNSLLTTSEAPLAATLGPNEVVAVELHVPSGAVTGDLFVVGANSSAETSPSYIAAPACGVAEPVTTASVGFANAHVLLEIAGSYAP